MLKFKARIAELISHNLYLITHNSRKMFVSENIIDKVVEQLETADFEMEIERFGKSQPALLGYVFSEDFELLTREEREYLLYLLIVIWKSIEKIKKDNPVAVENTSRKNSIDTPSVMSNALGEAEERNWELLDEVKETRFRERMNVFFDDSDQEDLLAFIEDALMEDDDESVVTKEGREPMFVALKTVVDVLMS